MIFPFDIGNKFLKEKIAVSRFSICRVDVKSFPSVRSDDKEIADLVLAPQPVQQRPAPIIKELLLISAEAVQIVENGIILPRSFRSIRIVAVRHINAVAHRMLQDFAVHGAAINASLRGNWKGRE